jgi:hypothetical protein
MPASTFHFLPGKHNLLGWNRTEYRIWNRDQAYQPNGLCLLNNAREALRASRSSIVEQIPVSEAGCPIQGLLPRDNCHILDPRFGARMFHMRFLKKGYNTTRLRNVPDVCWLLGAADVFLDVQSPLQLAQNLLCFFDRPLLLFFP